MVTTSYGSRTSEPATTTGAGARTLTIDARRYDAVLFDLDGVITDTAAVHARTWTKLFDEFFRRRAPRAGEDHSPFTDADYRCHVDGKTRIDGIQDFLSSRGISLEKDRGGTDPAHNTVAGLAARKQQLFQDELRAGVVAFDSAVALVHRLGAAGIRTAVYSSSMNCRFVLSAVGLDDAFDVVIDGRNAEQAGLKGKPDPALLLETAARLRLRPDRCVVIEDSQPGLIAARDGGFGMIVGLGSEHVAELVAAGADAVVGDLDEIAVHPAGRRMSSLPDALSSLDMLAAVLASRQPLILADFDGTLSDIVDDPARATILPSAKDALAALAAWCPVAVLSGRDALDVRTRVGVPGVWYGGNHGLEIISPDGRRHDHEDASCAKLSLHRAMEALQDALSDVVGLELEHKQYSIAVHHRRVDTASIARVTAAAHAIARREGLRVAQGRRVIELRPDMNWDKGSALRLVTESLGRTDVLAVYLGDDLTDEDAFDAVERDGIGILIRHEEDGDRPTTARLAVDSPAQAARLLSEIASRLEVEHRESEGTWSISFDGYDLKTELQREVLCGLGNGYLGSRGCAPEARAGDTHYPGTYRMGLYDRLTDTIAGHTVDNESLVNLPNWVPLTFAIDEGPWVDLDTGTHRLLNYHQEIDIRRAELVRRFRLSDDAGRVTSVVQRRFVSGTVQFRSTIDGGVTNRGVKRYQQLSGQHLEAPAFSDIGAGTVLCETQTAQSHVPIAIATRTTVTNAAIAPVDRAMFIEGTVAGHVIDVALQAGQSATVEKMVVVYTGRDLAISDPASAARKGIGRVGRYAVHVADHASSWSHLWESFRLHIDDDEALRVVRLHTPCICCSVCLPIPSTAAPECLRAVCRVRPIGVTSSGTTSSSFQY